jgi:UDP-4-amino-4,6-dideoxy-N-acetyl-beta-L-altrosamine transaminase
VRPIPYARQEVTDADLAAVAAVLRDDYWTTGPRVAAFEAAFAAYVGAPYAVAVSSGTAALHLCALALGVGPGDRWLVPSLTFVASANCIAYAGGSVELVDIDPATLLIDLDQVASKLAAAPGSYQGIVAVDFAGYPVAMDRVRRLADQYGLRIIEDSCHAPGGSFEDDLGQRHRCGDGSLADLAIFSFHPVKHIAAGEGGMITTADQALYQRLCKLRTHGITRDRSELSQDPGGWYYEMQELGYNYRLSDIHAALGHSQLLRAEAGLARRRHLAARYDAALADWPITTAPAHPGHAYHLYVIQVSERRALYDFLRQQQIFTQVHYIPVHQQPYYQRMFPVTKPLPQVEAYSRECLSLPLYPGLSEDEQDYVIGQLGQFLRKSSDG